VNLYVTSPISSDLQLLHGVFALRSRDSENRFCSFFWTNFYETSVS